MLHRFEQYAAEQHFFPSGQAVLLAVSGGRDSVCLAHLMHRSGHPFAIAHCNFHLRADESDRDQAFVRQLAADLQVPFHTVDFDTRLFATTHRLGIEEAARLLRYSYFAHLCHAHSYPCLATAHHRDDSIESLLLNLFRGTGIAGLHGIRPITDSTQWPTLAPDADPTAPLPTATLPLRIVRPLLPFSRQEIDHYVQRHSLAFVDDSTNAIADVRRNRIRLQLLPMARDIFPNADRTLAATIERMAEVEQVYRAHIDELTARLLQPRTSPFAPPHYAIPLDQLTTLQPRRTLLYEILAPYGFSSAACDDVARMLDHPRTGAHTQSATHEVLLDRRHLLLLPLVQATPPRIISSTLTPAQLPPLDALHHNQHIEYVDAHQVHLPLTVRPWQAGDRFQPLGMTGQRLVSDYLKDRKLNLAEKHHVYILEDADGRIVWLIGLRPAHHVRITPQTTQVLRLEWSDQTV